MIEIVKIANGLNRMVWVIEKNTTIRATLVLTDPDGDTQTDIIEHSENKNVPAVLFFLAFVVKIEQAPHYRARIDDGELSIGTASPDYSVQVTVEVL